MGKNSYGELGNGKSIEDDYDLDEKGLLIQVKVPDGTHFTQVITGSEHSLALDSNGNVWSWGNNGYGQLGDGTDINRSTPVQVTSDTTFTSISAGSGHTLALDANRNAWSWGMNYSGQLGDGTDEDKNTPVRVASDASFTHISAGEEHSLAIDSNGKAWSWGYNSSGQLGDGTYDNKNTPVRVASDASFTHISAGQEHSLAIDSNGKAWSWGHNRIGQLGDSTYTERDTPVQVISSMALTQISAGSDNSLALDSNGNACGWGSNFYGQNGDTSTEDHTTVSKLSWPIYTITGVSFAGVAASKVSEDATSRSWTVNVPEHARGKVNVIVSFRLDSRTTGGEIVPGDSNKTITLTYEYKTAYIVHFDLGEGPGVAPADQIVVEGERAHWPSGTNPSWGNHWFDGWFIPGGSAWNFNNPVDQNTTLIAKWEEYKFTVSPDRGPVSGGTTVSINAPKPPQYLTFHEVSGNWDHSLAIGSDGKVYAWGRNDYGQLGDETKNDSNVPVQVHTPDDVHFTKISAGRNHSLALDSDCNAWTWGNENGQQPPAPVNTSSKFTNISAGWSHSLALDGAGNVWTWGTNDCGQLGDGTTTDRFTPALLNTGSTFTSISTKYKHSLALDKKGRVWGWGWNQEGEIGNGETGTNQLTPARTDVNNTYTYISAGMYHSTALDSMGYAWSWGHNDKGQLGHNTTDDRQLPSPINSTTSFSSISAGANHTIALDKYGSAWSWGDNSYGQLGVNNTTNQLSPRRVATSTPLAKLSTGNFFTLALDNSNNTWSWGCNKYGQFGNHAMDDDPHSTPTQQIIQQVITLTGVTFGTVEADPAPIKGDSDNDWNLLSPAQTSNSVDVIIHWTSGGRAQEDYIVPKGFVYYSFTNLPRAGEIPLIRLSGLSMLGLSILGGLVLARRLQLQKKPATVTQK